MEVLNLWKLLTCLNFPGRPFFPVFNMFQHTNIEWEIARVGYKYNAFTTPLIESLKLCCIHASLCPFKELQDQEMADSRRETKRIVDVQDKQKHEHEFRSEFQCRNINFLLFAFILWILAHYIPSVLKFPIVFFFL